jgi:hypothetical protein
VLAFHVRYECHIGALAHLLFVLFIHRVAHQHRLWRSVRGLSSPPTPPAMTSPSLPRCPLCVADDHRLYSVGSVSTAVRCGGVGSTLRGWLNEGRCHVVVWDVRLWLGEGVPSSLTVARDCRGSVGRRPRPGIAGMARCRAGLFLGVGVSCDYLGSLAHQWSGRRRSPRWPDATVVSLFDQVH